MNQQDNFCFSAIFACDREYLFGCYKEGHFAMPWGQGEMSDDLEFFRAMTSGHVVIMGRKTFESIGRLLPGRLNLVFTHNPAVLPQEFKNLNTQTESQLPESGGYTISSWEELEFCLGGGGRWNLRKKLFVIGGAELLEQAFERYGFAELYFTIVEAVLGSTLESALGSTLGAEHLVYLPERLRQKLEEASMQRECIRVIAKDQRNRYNASIYKLTNLANS